MDDDLSFSLPSNLNQDGMLFTLDPSAPKEGVNRKEFYQQQFGPESGQITARNRGRFHLLVLQAYILTMPGNKGLISNMILIFFGYFTKAKHIGDKYIFIQHKQIVLALQTTFSHATKEGVASFLSIPNTGLKELRNLSLPGASQSLPALSQFAHSRKVAPVNCRFMAPSSTNGTGKKNIRIDISSDTVCPWCFVGKRYLDKAIADSKDQFDFELRWKPFLLNPSAPKEGVNKIEFYRQKFGSGAEQIHARMAEVMKSLGLEYNMDGLIGDTLDSHRLIYYAGQQGLDKQHDLVEELFLGYFTQAKYIGDRDFLVECAKKVGIEGAAEFLEDPNNGLKDVYEELEKYSANINGVPHFVINDQQRLSGAQPPEVFKRAFQVAAK
ncbi:LOW QUALITY PROTEIN: hypothetical protein Cgig2_007679 [Carnegiea gigantea]|uniref:DSBA-like thioredoxin domain-containing protein n=1 Tax=Carnegiea gigantea TaxID=171969 RepID=A0A9Q1QC63_9CARY|nr:LOW QUALITY PROTEIN: hypothetical protein Cgig2_007679 [Carnegiea gigantea]